MLPRLHIVTDDEILGTTGFVLRASTLVREFGSRIAIHLRSRSAGGGRLYEIAANLGQHADAFIVINDRVDVARVAGAQAVQLPAASLPIEIVREQLPGVLIGKSVHAAGEGIPAVQAGADFLVAGSIYASGTHPAATPQGSALIHALRGCGAPVLAIGGIDASRIVECMNAGAYGVAVIRAVWQARDPVVAAAELVERIEQSRVNP
ncbi:MAG: thiamine phosphate synthase [Gemmatimonadota bacterium]